MSTSWSFPAPQFQKPTLYFDYRVGVTSSNMLRLRDMGIPAPDQVLYRPYAESYLRGDNSRVGDGEPMIEWVWDIKAIHELSKLVQMWFSTQTTTFADNVFIKSDLRDGQFPEPQLSFKVFDCTVWRPELFGPDGTPVARSSKAIQTVRFQFINLVEVP